MRELFNIDNNTLDNFDMSRYSLISNLEYQKYYTEKSSKEHYRLLTHLSQQLNGEIIIDIGTLKGCSALALSFNLSNKVYSFNLSEEKELNTIPENCEFKVDNILIQFYNHLKQLGYKGYLLLDDIFLNKEMVEFWNLIELEKQDLTSLGHATGTGVVYFN